MVRRALLSLSALGCLLTWTALPSAQSASRVRVTMQDGRVTLSAQQASLQAILHEWSRIGQSTIVNADTINAPPVTIELTDVSEQQALQMLLRPTGGFIAVPRTSDAPGVSAYARIVILPVPAPASTSTTSVARTYAPPPAAVTPMPVVPQPIATQTPGVMRLIGANGLPVPDDQADGVPPGVTRAPAGYVSGGDPPPRPAAVPTSGAITPTPPTKLPTGTVGASAPGVITPLPQAAPAPAPQPPASTPQR